MKQNSVHDRKKKSKATDKKATQQLPAGIKQQIISMGWSNMCSVGKWSNETRFEPLGNHTGQQHCICQFCVSWGAQHDSKKFLQQCFHRGAFHREMYSDKESDTGPGYLVCLGFFFFFAYHPKHTVLRLQNYVTGNIITQWTLSLKVVNAIRGTVSTGASMRTLRTLHKHT